MNRARASVPAAISVLMIFNATFRCSEVSIAQKVTAVPLYANVQARARIAKAQADTRAIASAVSIYSAHCGGLPDNTSNAQTCAAATGQNGALPGVLLTQQTNAQNQLGGPFLNSTPTLPAGWGGSGTSYKYTTTAAGTFTICGTGDSTGADSNGGAPTACP